MNSLTSGSDRGMDRVAAVRVRRTGMQPSPGSVHTRNRSSLCFFKLMDCDALDYELAGCPVASSATASRGITGRDGGVSPLPELPSSGTTAQRCRGQGKH